MPIDPDFAAQFDRSNEAYHAGSEQIAAIGGARVPNAMVADKDWENRPIPDQEEKPAPVLPELQAVMDRRAAVGTLKKVILAFCTPLQRLYEEKENGTEDVTSFQAAVDAAWTKVIDATAGFTEENAPIAMEVMDLAKSKLETVHDKASYGEFAFEARRWGQKLFAQQKKMLEEIKAIKKAAAT